MKPLRWFPVLIVLWLCSLAAATQAQQVSVSAADYSLSLAPGTITAAFGTEMAAGTEAAASLPLPTKLGSTRVLVNGQAAPLFFVSPNQINYQIPVGTQPGDVEVIVERDGSAKSRELIQLRSAAFAIFTQDQTGTGTGAIIDGRSSRNGPFSVHTNTGEQTILALYGTGLGEAGSRSFVSNRVHVYVGGIEAKISYAGPQPDFAGLDQINFELPEAVADHGTLPVTIKIDDQSSNSATLDVVTADTASVSVALAPSAVAVSDVMTISPFADLDSLRVTIKSFNLVTDKGVEVSLISASQTIDLLSPESAAKLIKVSPLKAGVYVAETAAITEVVASYKGQAVKIALASKSVQQKLPEPFKLEKDTTVGIRLAFDLRASVRKQTDGSYIFDPVLLLSRIVSTGMPTLQTISGKIVGIDKGTKQFKLLKAESSNSVVVVDASKAAIISDQGKPTDFAALANDQKVDVSGKLDDKGVVQASAIYIGGIKLPVLPANLSVVTGTVSSINRTAKTFEVKVDIFSGPFQTFAKVDKLTIRWDDKTLFIEDLGVLIKADDLTVGTQVGVLILDLKDLISPALASSVLILHPHVSGTIADVKGLPTSFVVNVLADPRSAAPTRLVTVNLKATTKIRNVFNETLKPENLIAGSLVDVVCDTLTGNTATAELIFVLGVQLNGTVAPADVKAADSSFVLTPANGVKNTVKVDAKTILIAGSGFKIQQLKADEFFKLLLNKPYALEVFGLLDAPNTVRALTIRLEDKK